MHNIKDIRNNFDNFKNIIKSRNISINLDQILDLDKKNRTLIQEKETLEQEKKGISKSQDKSLFAKSKEISLSVSEKIPLNSKGILKPNDLGRLRVEIYKYISKPNIQIDNILKNIGHK